MAALSKKAIITVCAMELLPFRDMRIHPLIALIIVEFRKRSVRTARSGNPCYIDYIIDDSTNFVNRWHVRQTFVDNGCAELYTCNLARKSAFTRQEFMGKEKAHRMSPPTKELMKLTLEQMLAHGGHPALRWMIDNIFAKTDPAGNIKPDKEKSKEKIDSAIATIMALDRAIRHGGTGGSVYDGRGLLAL